MLHGMSIGRLLAGRMILVETKQSALPIVKGRLTSQVAQTENMKPSMPLPNGSQHPVTNLARTWTSEC
jgi:hypothetical protein